MGFCPMDILNNFVQNHILYHAKLSISITPQGTTNIERLFIYLGSILKGFL